MDDFFQKYTDELLEKDDYQVIGRWTRYDERKKTEAEFQLDDVLPNSIGWELKNGLRSSLNIQLKENYGSHIDETKLNKETNNILENALVARHPDWILDSQQKLLREGEIRRCKCEQCDINFYIVSVPFSLKAITLQAIFRNMNKGVEEEFTRRKQKLAHKLLNHGDILTDISLRYKIDHLQTKLFSNQDVCNLLKNKPELFGEIVKDLVLKLLSNSKGVMEASIVKSVRLEVMKCVHCETNLVLQRGKFTYCQNSHLTCNECQKKLCQSMKTKQKLETILEVCNSNLYNQRMIKFNAGDKSKEGRCIKCKGELKRGNFPGGRLRTRFFWRSADDKAFKLTTR